MLNISLYLLFKINPTIHIGIVKLIYYNILKSITVRNMKRLFTREINKADMFTCLPRLSETFEGIPILQPFFINSQR